MRFAGLRERTGPLTLAQANVKLMLDADEDHFDWNQCVHVAVPPGADVDAALTALVRRHESLRTVIAGDTQVVLGAGSVPTVVRRADADPDRLAVELRRSTRFDLAAEVPLKAVVLTDGGRPVRLLLLLSHIAADLIGVRLVQRDIALLLDGRELPPAPQAVDVANDDHSAAWQRRTARALRYWESELSAMPPAAFAGPPAGGCYGLRLLSGEGAEALTAASTRLRASPSTVLLSLFAVLVGAHAGRDRVAIVSVSANRPSRLCDYVGTLAQDALLVADVRQPTVDDVVEAMRSRAVRAYANSRFEATALWQLIERRGFPFPRDVVFNDRSGEDGVPGTPGITRLPDESYPTRCLLFVDAVRPQLALTLRADPGNLPEERGEALLHDLAGLLTRLAEGPTENPAQ